MVLVQGFHKNYERKGVYEVLTVLSRLGDPHAVFDGDVVPLCATRYHVFALSITCVSCHLKGLYFAKERCTKIVHQSIQATGDRWHFNLYGQNVQGGEVMLTQDHIIPVSKGGRNNIENLRTMCSPCNTKRGNRGEFQSSFMFPKPAILIP